MANGSPPAQSEQSIDQWLADLERRQTQLEIKFQNFLNMLRNSTHMTTSYLDRELGYTTHEQQRQARSKRGR